MRVAIIHQDLGVGILKMPFPDFKLRLGGAERLVVDAAKSLQDRGHSVTFYTCHYDPNRCFEDTKGDSGLSFHLISLLIELNIVVAGNWIPRSFFGYGHLACLILRGFYLVLWMYLVSPNNYDWIIIDQFNYYMWILRRCARHIVYYCHFPETMHLTKSKNAMKRLYHSAMYNAENETIKASTLVAVNSHYTAESFRKYHGGLGVEPVLLYPGVDEKCLANCDPSILPLPIPSSKKILTSINRFDPKKNIKLAIESLVWLTRRGFGEKVLLVLAGGYDVRVAENVAHLKELQNLCDENSLTYATVWPGNKVMMDSHANVIFMPSISDLQRNALLGKTFCLLYTPSNEHFGIVPLEGMAMGIPVIGINSGGPRETIIDGTTGFLCEPSASEIGSRVQRLLKDDTLAARMSQTARKHVASSFSMKHFGNNLELILSSAARKL